MEYITELRIINKETKKVLRVRDVSDRTLPDVALLFEGALFAVNDNETVVLKRYVK
jgi:hypothetical protein